MRGAWLFFGSALVIGGIPTQTRENFSAQIFLGVFPTIQNLPMFISVLKTAQDFPNVRARSSREIAKTKRVRQACSSADRGYQVGVVPTGPLVEFAHDRTQPGRQFPGSRNPN